MCVSILVHLSIPSKTIDFPPAWTCILWWEEQRLTSAATGNDPGNVSEHLLNSLFDPYLEYLMPIFSHFQNLTEKKEKNVLELLFIFCLQISQTVVAFFFTATSNMV